MAFCPARPRLMLSLQFVMTTRKTQKKFARSLTFSSFKMWLCLTTRPMGILQDLSTRQPPWCFQKTRQICRSQKLALNTNPVWTVCIHLQALVKADSFLLRHRRVAVQLRKTREESLTHAMFQVAYIPMPSNSALIAMWIST